MPSLFDPLSLKGVLLRNRIAVSPMCQYSAEDGRVTRWHLPHYVSLARGGAGLVIVEATAVSAEGRITLQDLGLWNDEQAESLIPIVDGIKSSGSVPGIQLAHAGRKASAYPPWKGGHSMNRDDPRAWEIIAPSSLAFGGGLTQVPRAMTLEDICRVQKSFVSAAIRARELNFEWLLLHFAHGYLCQSFFSRHSNRREDEYGGNFKNRARFLVEMTKSVREVWPQNRVLAARLGVIEFDGHDEETLEESILLIKNLKEAGLDFIDVSIGFSTPSSQIPWESNFMVKYAHQIRLKTGLPTATSWLIHDPKKADEMIREEQLDLVMLARPMLENPHWPLMAAKCLRIDHPAWILPVPYAHWLSRYR